ncbi:MAG TPA: fatty acid oxidation complex subunit alpha FadJ [Gemmatimonadaceae bacterium]|nr:fatty acid oxidation complex subunit alpha FadJ [Gemmatimonadaceae bacterium]
MTTTRTPPETETVGTLATERLDGGIVVVTLDVPGAPVNVLGPRVRQDVSALLDRLESDPSIRAAVLTSGKPDVFIAGADVEELLGLETAADAERLSREGQKLLQRLEDLRVPVVAAIHGSCLGGGLETALACAYRIATDDPKTGLGFPEVQLGLIPGAGGTQRLPQTVGLRAALDLILTGRTVRGRQALRLGLVDELVHPAILRDVALDRARALADGRLSPSQGRRRRGVADFLLDENPAGRAIVLRRAREQTLARTKGHYPAPLTALDVVATGYHEGDERGYFAEARKFGELVVGEVARELTFLFFATTALKKDPGVAAPAPDPLPVEKIAVLGAGFMGAGIAAVAALQQTLVRLKDTDDARVGRGLRAARDVFEERLKKRRLTRPQFQDLLALVGGTTRYSGFGNVDLCIEAVFEDVALKQQVLREAEAVLPPDAIYASNTSTIPIGVLADASRRPEHVLGMHFFSPVPKMPLLEVIVTPRTSPTATVTAVAYGKRLGKTVIVVNDGPGFYTTRTLAAYMNEAGFLLDEGVSIEAVDRAMVDFGFPVGPITLLDEVGLDVAGKVATVLSEAFGARMPRSRSLQRVLEAGRTGRKGRSGFYLYDKRGKKGAVDASVYTLLPTGPTRLDRPAGEMQQRLVLAMVNEAARCLDEGVLRSPRDGDVGAVFGIGFPPFRGGPFRYVDAVGAPRIVKQLEELEARFPDRFAPATPLLRMAARGERFYPERGKPV